MGKFCKKCFYLRQETDNAPDYECPKCGAVYAKVDSWLNAQAELLRPKDEDRKKTNLRKSRFN